MPHFSPLSSPRRRPRLAEAPACELLPTLHVLRRMQQRAISWDHVALVLEYGREYWAGSGITAYHVGRRVVSIAHRNGLRLDQATDLSILVSSDGVLITAQHMRSIPRSWKAA